MKSVSIFVIAYNMEKYIEKCISSLLRQTYQNYKIVLIENGSNEDNTRKIIEDYASRYDKINKIIIEKNRQYGNALEIAINNCDTEYFIICDPDDYLSDDALERLMNNIEDADMIFGSRNIFYEDSDDIDYDSCINNKNTSIKNDNVSIDDDKYNDFFFMNPTPHSKLYKTELVKNIKIPKETFTDNVLYFKAILEANKIIYNQDLNVSYYLINRKGNSTTTYKPNYIKAFNIMTKGLIENIIKTKNYDKFKTIFNLRLYLSLKEMINILHIIKGDKKEIYQYMIELYEIIFEQVIEDKKLFSNYQKYYNLDKYDYLLLNEYIGKLAYKRSIRKIINQK